MESCKWSEVASCDVVCSGEEWSGVKNSRVE